MKDLILLIVQRLVTHPEAVEVMETEGDTISVIEVRVTKEDLVRVIGKQGRTAHAIRTITSAIAARTNRQIILDFVE